MVLMKIMNVLVFGSEIEVFRNVNCCILNMYILKDNLFVIL